MGKLIPKIAKNVKRCKKNILTICNSVSIFYLSNEKHRRRFGWQADNAGYFEEGNDKETRKKT
ncbi:hypothetical protein TREVI0001_2148 [Treponema vincentii ATCC 35580]|uniref:Uncharacterized protein n=1 Tax=Treponema vincentii ATCC 35580 TaxID=596324 RepID=C8PQP0_9SPIR|nr:hypothetical protein TREVI0001_2148 [Treponema vincentii ATCC 35580]